MFIYFIPIPTINIISVAQKISSNGSNIINYKEFPKSFTAKYSDWELFYELQNLTITTARKIETHIKKMKSRKYLENIKAYPEISQKLIEKYSEEMISDSKRNR